jgi:hypothetical protein
VLDDIEIQDAQREVDRVPVVQGLAAEWQAEQKGEQGHPSKA